MMVFPEAAAAYAEGIGANESVRMLTPSLWQTVTTTTLFRTSDPYTGRGDAWYADLTTAPCSGGDCLTAVYPGGSTADGNVTVDDMEGLPVDRDAGKWSAETATPGTTGRALPQLLVYYRHDWFERLGLAPPATWGDLADWAAALNGTVDVDGDGAADWALCLDTAPLCKSGYLLLAMAASGVQPERAQGTFFHPPTLTPLTSTPAFEQALETYGRLIRYSLPTPDEGSAPNTTTTTTTASRATCRAYDPPFLAGKCLLTLNFDTFRVSRPGAPARNALPPGALGVARLPGSETMLDRDANATVPCNVSSCANAINATCFVAAEARPAGSGAASWAPRACRVNVAPLLASVSYDVEHAPDTLLAVRAASSMLEEDMSMLTRVWPEMLSRTRLTAGATAPGAVVLVDGAEESAGGRRRLGSDWANRTTMGPLIELGYDPVEARRFLDAYWGSLLAPASEGGEGSEAAVPPGPGRNTVEELGLRGSSFFMRAYAQAAYWMRVGNMSASAVASRATRELDWVVSLVAANRTRLAFKYCNDIGWREPDGGGGPAKGSDTAGRRKKMNAGGLAAAILFPLATVLMAVALAAVVARCLLRRRGLTVFGSVVPPGAGPGTSLILTDIQNSTVLWETLPADVMDEALRCHHEVLRSLLPAHRGYESATEGDAFILAFHTAEDAARYAVAAQVLLAEAPWPEAMLGHPDGEVSWVEPQRSDPIASLSYVSKELLSVITRAVQTGTAPGHNPFPAPRSKSGRNLGPSPSRPHGAPPAAASAGEARRKSGDRSGKPNRWRITAPRPYEMADGFRLAVDVPDSILQRVMSGVAAGGKLPGSVTAGGAVHKCASDINTYMSFETGQEHDADAAARGEEGGHGSTRAPQAQDPAGRHPANASSLTFAQVRSVLLTKARLSSLAASRQASVTQGAEAGAGGAAGTGAGRGSAGLEISAVEGGALSRHKAAAAAYRHGDGSLHKDSTPAAGALAVATLTEALRHGWRRATTGAAAADDGDGADDAGASETRLLAFRGMRVRMGIHTGCTDPAEVSLNKATGRNQYSGAFMTVAKAVCDVAHGGQVVMSAATFKQLPPACLSKCAFLLHMGEHALDEAASGTYGTAGSGTDTDGPEPEPLYQILPYSLSCRLPFFEPLRSHAYLSLGMPDAPVGRVTVAFMYVIGAQTLLSWNASVANTALRLFQGVVSEQLNALDGYVVELVDGLCLATFRSPADALLWSLRCGRRLLAAHWPEELLEHELCEEVSVPLAGGQSAASATAAAAAAALAAVAEAAEAACLPPAHSLPAPLGGGGLLEARPSYGAPLARHFSAMASLPSALHHPHLQPHSHPTLSRSSALRTKTLMRGLRLKVGMDAGRVSDSINASTGRMAYRGRPMNRAARIAAKALAGQVRCSAGVWAGAAERLAVVARSGGEDEVTATSLGLHSFKGVMEKIEVMSVSFKGATLSEEEVAVVARRAPRISTAGSSAALTASLGSSHASALSGLTSIFSGVSIASLAAVVGPGSPATTPTPRAVDNLPSPAASGAGLAPPAAASGSGSGSGGGSPCRDAVRPRPSSGILSAFSRRSRQGFSPGGAVAPEADRMSGGGSGANGRLRSLLQDQPTPRASHSGAADASHVVVHMNPLHDAGASAGGEEAAVAAAAAAAAWDADRPTATSSDGNAAAGSECDRAAPGRRSPGRGSSSDGSSSLPSLAMGAWAHSKPSQLILAGAAGEASPASPSAAPSAAASPLLSPGGGAACESGPTGFLPLPPPVVPQQLPRAHPGRAPGGAQLAAGPRGEDGAPTWD